MSDHRQPARRNALSLIVGLLFAAALAVIAVRCTSRSNSDAPGADATQGEEPASTAAAPPPTTAPEVAPTPAPQASAARDAGAPTSIGRLMRATDTHDRDLLATIERKTHAAPPATARELLELRRAGKSRAELERFIH